MLKMLKRILPPAAMRSVTAGIFTSKLVYGLPVVGACWQQSRYRAKHLQKLSLTKQDMGVLQALQNKAMRILVGDRASQKSTAELLGETDFLSVHQLCWWTALKAIEKCLRCGKPK